MAAYDPKRTRPHREPDEEVTPQIDALLDPIDLRDEPELVEPVVAPVIEPEPAPEPAPVVEKPVPPVLVAPAPDQNTQRVAVVAGLAAATVAGIVLWRRSRRRR